MEIIGLKGKNLLNNLIIKRILSSVLILILLISLIFFLLRLAPGNPVQKFVSPALSPKLAEKVRTSFSLNKPVTRQYIDFVKNIVTGNFGISYQQHKPVVDVIKEYLPFTVIFSFISFLIQIGFGFLFAFYAFKNKGKFSDELLSKLSLILYSIPAFVLGILLIYLFSVTIPLFPSADLRSVDFDDLTLIGKIFDYVKHLILPLATLSIPGIVIYYKYLRENLDSVNNKTFINHLRINGFDEKTILKKHIIPNTIGPLISVAGIELGLLLSGALITEVIFSLPGMGRLTVGAILNRDYPLIIGCTFIAGLLVIITNFLADIIRYKLDKRMLKGI